MKRPNPSANFPIPFYLFPLLVDQTIAGVERLDYEELIEIKYVTGTKSRYLPSEFNVEVELEEEGNVLRSQTLELIHV